MIAFKCVCFVCDVWPVFVFVCDLCCMSCVRVVFVCVCVVFLSLHFGMCMCVCDCACM